MDVIARIKEQMELRGWTEYRLAKESGLPQTTVSNLFRRNTLPSLPTLESICRSFGLNMSSFFDEQEKTPFPDALWNTLSQGQRALLTELMRELSNQK